MTDVIPDVIDASTTRCQKPGWYEGVVQCYEARTPTSKAAFERPRGLIPGGVPAGLGCMSPYPGLSS